VGGFEFLFKKKTFLIDP